MTAGRAVLVWPATDDPTRVARTARILMDYCERCDLTVSAIAGLTAAREMLAGDLVDALVVRSAMELLPAGIHVVESLAGRPMPVDRTSLNPVEETQPATRRRPRIVRGGAS